MDLLTGGGWFKYCWFKDCWARSLFTAYCWFSSWAITSCWLTSWGLMGVDTSPGCRLGSGVRTEGWLPWDSWAGEGGCSAVLPGAGCWPKLTWLAACWDSSDRLSISTAAGERENHVSQRYSALLRRAGPSLSTERHGALKVQRNQNISGQNPTGCECTFLFCARQPTLKGGKHFLMLWCGLDLRPEINYLHILRD